MLPETLHGGLLIQNGIAELPSHHELCHVIGGLLSTVAMNSLAHSVSPTACAVLAQNVVHIIATIQYG